MYGKTAKSGQFYERVASMSTRARATGVNLLGWEEPEEMTPEQKRQALILASKALAKDASETKIAIGRCKSANERAILNALRDEQKIKARQINAELLKLPSQKFKKVDGLHDYIIEVCKKRFSKITWNQIIEEARENMRNEENRIEAKRQTDAAHVKDESQQVDNDASTQSGARSGLHLADSGRVQSQS